MDVQNALSLDGPTLQERVLQAYYMRLNAVDKSVYELTSVFFGINTSIAALVFYFIRSDYQQLALAIVGYVASVALFLIVWKHYFAWGLYAEDMKKLEDELGYSISTNYERRLKNTPGATVRASLVRLRFNFLFSALWLVIIGYFIRRFACLYYFPPFWLNSTLYIFGFLLVASVPWAYFAGTWQPRVYWRVVRTLWAREA